MARADRTETLPGKPVTGQNCALVLRDLVLRERLESLRPEAAFVAHFDWPERDHRRGAPAEHRERDEQKAAGPVGAVSVVPDAVLCLKFCRAGEGCGLCADLSANGEGEFDRAALYHRVSGVDLAAQNVVATNFSRRLTCLSSEAIFILFAHG